jgi:hypothetical protein
LKFCSTVSTRTLVCAVHIAFQISSTNPIIQDLYTYIRLEKHIPFIQFSCMGYPYKFNMIMQASKHFLNDTSLTGVKITFQMRFKSVIIRSFVKGGVGYLFE